MLFRRVYDHLAVNLPAPGLGGKFSIIIGVKLFQILNIYEKRKEVKLGVFPAFTFCCIMTENRMRDHTVTEAQARRLLDSLDVPLKGFARHLWEAKRVEPMDEEFDEQLDIHANKGLNKHL